MKRALLMFAAENQMGLEVGRDTATTSISTAIREAIVAKTGVQLRDNILGLDVFSEQQPARWIQVSGRASVSRVIRDYESRLSQLFEKDRPLTPTQQLAIEVYNLSHFEPATRARFLTLVTVVEVIAPRLKRSLHVRAALNRLIASIRRFSTLPPDEKRRLSQAVANLKQESIGHACTQFVTKYGDANDVSYFTTCYRARSELLHDGFTERPEALDSVRLRQLVSRLLVASITDAA
jgi:hypothetical protein